MIKWKDRSLIFLKQLLDFFLALLFHHLTFFRLLDFFLRPNWLFSHSTWLFFRPQFLSLDFFPPPSFITWLFSAPLFYHLTFFRTFLLLDFFRFLKILLLFPLDLFPLDFFPFPDFHARRFWGLMLCCISAMHLYFKFLNNIWYLHLHDWHFIKYQSLAISYCNVSFLFRQVSLKCAKYDKVTRNCGFQFWCKHHFQSGQGNLNLLVLKDQIVT